MYHAFVRQEIGWVSFGLHSPSQQWTTFIQSLERTFGSQNVAYVYWSSNDKLNDVYDIRKRVEGDVKAANQVQTNWDAGKIPDMSRENGQLHLSRGIASLQRAARPSAPQTDGRMATS